MNTVTTNDFPPTLRKALFGNAAFSLCSALVFCLAYQELGGWMGLDAPWLLAVIGSGLFLFAALIGFTGTRPLPNPALVWTIIVADLAWVVGSFVLLKGFRDLLNTNGQLLVWAIAFVVMVFAVLQIVGLRQYRPA